MKEDCIGSQVPQRTVALEEEEEEKEEEEDEEGGGGKHEFLENGGHLYSG